MDVAAAVNLYPSHRTKIIHLVRHAQGFHNVAIDENWTAALSEDYFDARLTPLGWEQTDALRKHVRSSGFFKTIELVITSPMSRTIQTAVGAFGGEEHSDDLNVPPLMVEDAGDSNRPAISSLNCPPFLAIEDCRESIGITPCDRRRNISEYRPLYPAIDFSMIEHDEDVLWKPDVRETDDEMAARGLKFFKWLLTRKEKEIAVVSHSGILFNSMREFGNDCDVFIQSEIREYFANAELRSIVLIDRSRIGSDSSNNFPGGIPRGLDLPVDIAIKKNPEFQKRLKSLVK
ncbi:phosphoglycerate mutase-like protein 1 [Momordica charantia]|uniref:Phosphoglycerate mutase-like protein 1 n=1 Tax=Momordica charantia TaxID=3673 RepID=A0A6J1C354_MOMCH|nr:phosphoglycerate mutase-like protein 1 [Momordica charantia]XP_022136301.1 phosphoglycerate mutase-like protein 1 [Momordica charantia]